MLVHGMKPYVHDHDRLGRRVALGWTLLAALLIVFVSLAPFRFDASPAAVERNIGVFKASLLWPRDVTWHWVRDLATNFVFYLPLGLLLPWAQRPRHRSGSIFGLSLGALLSLALEALQVFAVARYPSFTDWLMNSAGHAFGYGIMAIIIGHYRLGPAILLGRREGTSRERLAAGLRTLYLSLLVPLSLLPLDISVQAIRLWERLQGGGDAAGRILLDPTGPWDAERLAGMVRAFALLLPAGFLDRLARGRRGGLLQAMLLGAVVALLIESAQLVVLSRTSDVMQPLAAALGAGFGALAAMLLLAPADRAAELAPAERRRAILPLAILGYCLILMVVSWRPFEFLDSPMAVARKLRFETSWIPYLHYLHTRSLASWLDIGREIGWYIPLGLLMGLWLDHGRVRWRARVRVALGLALVLAVGIFFELGQSMIVGRYVDLTDMLNHGLGGLAGLILARLLRSETRVGQK